MRRSMLVLLCGALAGPGCHVEPGAETVTEETDAFEIDEQAQPGEHNPDKVKCYAACNKALSDCAHACQSLDGEAYLECLSECTASHGHCISMCDTWGGCTLGTEGC